MSIVLVVGGVVYATGTLGGKPGPAVGEVAGVVATPEPTDIGGPIFSIALPSREPVASEGGAANLSGGGAVGGGSSGGSDGSGGGTSRGDDAGGGGTPVVATPLHGPDPATLSGYRWPIPNARLTLPFGPSPWGSHLVERQGLPRRHRPGHLLRRPDRRGP